jgi:hypothetical protein
MKKTELKHLAAYLPYNIFVKRYGFANEIIQLTTDNIKFITANNDLLRLRPLNQLIE